MANFYVKLTFNLTNQRTHTLQIPTETYADAIDMIVSLDTAVNQQKAITLAYAPERAVVVNPRELLYAMIIPGERGKIDIESSDHDNS